MANLPPNWQYEQAAFIRWNISHLCGVDEAGRGPLAGPVVAAAVSLPPRPLPQELNHLNDSKKLSKTRRDALFDALTAYADIGVGLAEPAEIDRCNILAASLIAMQRAVNALPQTVQGALIDGPIAPRLHCHTLPIIKGDQKSLSIASASIIAKVTRDRLMQVADRRFSAYGFAQHKGYPTRTHLRALDQYGICPLHRRSFAPVKKMLVHSVS